MSYSYVPRKQYMPFKRQFDEILHQMQAEIKKNYGITMEIRLVGSGANNCVTKCGDNGPWDLDYNLIINKDPKGILDSPEKLKKEIMHLIHDIIDHSDNLSGCSISFGKNSTVPITYSITDGKSHVMSFDVAIIRNTKNRSMRLVFDKLHNRYIWNKLRSGLHSDKDIRSIKNNGLINELRQRYLEKKNGKHNSDIPSFILFDMAIDETLQSLKHKHNHSTPTQSKEEVKKMAKVSGNNHSKSQMDHHSNQKNSNSAAYKASQDNRSNQLNPNNAQYNGGNNSKSGR